MTKEKFWAEPLSDFMKRLDTSDNGLSKDQVKARKKQYGPNTVVVQKKKLVFLQFLARFQSPLIILLLMAGILAAFVREIYSSIIILLMVIISVSVDFFQEYRAGKATEKLRQSMAHRSTVLRNGEIKDILSSDLVLGDVVVLNAGDLIPADGRMFFAKTLFVNQAALTGESFPVLKTADDLIKPSDGTDTKSCLKSLLLAIILEQHKPRFG